MQRHRNEQLDFRMVKKLYWQEQRLGLVRFGGREDEENVTSKLVWRINFFI